jgi:hypothetical protein
MPTRRSRLTGTASSTPTLIKTGERTYCIVAEWTDMDSLAKARPNMIASLDSFRDTLEDLGSGLGVTDPVSGPVVLAEVVRGQAARRLIQ